MPKLTQVTPFFFVQDLDEAVRFYKESLGFKLYVRYNDYAYLHRDGAGIRLLRGAAGPASTAYFDVEDVDALWGEFRSRLGDELRNNPEGPRDQSYGQREFTVFSPGNHTLFFGQEIFRDEPAWERAARE